MATSGMDFGWADEYMSRLGAANQAQGNQLSMDKILTDYFLPEFERTQGKQEDLEKRVLEALGAGPDFEQYRGELTTMAQGVTDELFGEGGAVNQALRGARGETVQSGFGTTSGGYDRARQNIFSQARSEVTNRVAQGALQLAPLAAQSRAGDIASLLDMQQSEAGRLEGLREGLFTGQAGIDQFGLANRQQRLNEQLTEEALRKSRDSGGGGGFGGFVKGLGRAAAGIAVGSFAGPLGAAAGAKAADWLF